MRHSRHRHTLGLKKEHRAAVLSQLASQLITYGRITTTLAKARALRPFAEKIVTLAVRAKKTDRPERAVYLRRLAVARLRDEGAARLLFNEKADEFVNRPGGYTRIYKLVKRRGDGADMAIIELINASDEGYGKKKRSKSKQKAAPQSETATEPEATAELEAVAAAPEAETAAEEQSEETKD